MPIGAEAFDPEFEEAFEEDWGESFEERGRVRAPRVTTAKPTPLPPRPTDRPVTQTQLQAAVTKLNGDIARNSTAIQKVNSNLGALGRDVRRQSTQTRDTRRDISAMRDAVVLLPLLSSTIGTSNPTLSALFPMMMLSGIGEGQQGSSSQSGGMFGGGDSSTTMLMVLALSGALNK